MKEELKELLRLYKEDVLFPMHSIIHNHLDIIEVAQPRPHQLQLNCGNPNCEDCNPKFPTMTGINNPEG
jgi:hypothetical protein